MNYAPGDVVPNAVLAKVGAGGKVCIYTLAETDIVIDVNGYVPDRGSPWALVPARLLESRRVGERTVDGLFEGIGRRACWVGDRVGGGWVVVVCRLMLMR